MLFIHTTIKCIQKMYSENNFFWNLKNITFYYFLLCMLHRYLCVQYKTIVLILEYNIVVMYCKTKKKNAGHYDSLTCSIVFRMTCTCEWGICYTNTCNLIQKTFTNLNVSEFNCHVICQTLATHLQHKHLQTLATHLPVRLVCLVWHSFLRIPFATAPHFGKKGLPPVWHYPWRLIIVHSNNDKGTCSLFWPGIFFWMLLLAVFAKGHVYSIDWGSIL